MVSYNAIYANASRFFEYIRYTKICVITVCSYCGHVTNSAMHQACLSVLERKCDICKDVTMIQHSRPLNSLSMNKTKHYQIRRKFWRKHIRIIYIQFTVSNLL